MRLQLAYKFLISAGDIFPVRDKDNLNFGGERKGSRPVIERSGNAAFTASGLICSQGVVSYISKLVKGEVKLCLPMIHFAAVEMQVLKIRLVHSRDRP